MTPAIPPIPGFLITQPVLDYHKPDDPPMPAGVVVIAWVLVILGACGVLSGLYSFWINGRFSLNWAILLVAGIGMFRRWAWCQECAVFFLGVSAAVALTLAVVVPLVGAVRSLPIINRITSKPLAMVTLEVTCLSIMVLAFWGYRVLTASDAYAWFRKSKAS